ncbi:MAG: hypothetical protein WCD44_03475, partial [Candidatus Babeliales bacterium]
VTSFISTKNKESMKEKAALVPKLIITQENFIKVFQERVISLIVLAFYKPTQASQVIPFINKTNINAFVATKGSILFLKNLYLKGDTNIRNQILSLITEKTIVTFSKNKTNKKDLLSYLLTITPNIAPHLTSLITKNNFVDLTKTNPIFLILLIEKNQDTASHLSALVTENNLTHFTKSPEDIAFLLLLMEKDLNAATYFTSLIIENNFIDLIKTNAEFLILITKKNVEAIPYFTQLLENNYADLLFSHEYWQHAYILDLVKESELNIEKLINLHEDSLYDREQAIYCSTFLKKLINSSQSLKKIFETNYYYKTIK